METNLPPLLPSFSPPRESTGCSGARPSPTQTKHKLDIRRKAVGRQRVNLVLFRRTIVLRRGEKLLAKSYCCAKLKTVYSKINQPQRVANLESRQVPEPNSLSSRSWSPMPCSGDVRPPCSILSSCHLPHQPRFLTCTLWIKLDVRANEC